MVAEGMRAWKESGRKLIIGSFGPLAIGSTIGVGFNGDFAPVQLTRRATREEFIANAKDEGIAAGKAPFYYEVELVADSANAGSPGLETKPERSANIQ